MIDKRKRKIVYSNFQDTIGDITEIDLNGVTESVFDLSYFRQQVEIHLRKHLNHISIQRLRHGHPLTDTDLNALENMLLDSGAGSKEDL